MSFLERLRHNLSVLVLWCAFLALSLGGAAMLGIGLFFASREWWVVIHQRASTWEVARKTVEVLVPGLGLLLVLILPISHRRSVGRSGTRKAEQRTRTQGRVSVAD